MRDLLVVKIDPTRLDDPEIAAEGERERLKALAAQFSREDLMRAFDLLVARRVRDQRLVAAAASLRDGAGEVDPPAEAHAARRSSSRLAKVRQARQARRPQAQARSRCAAVRARRATAPAQARPVAAPSVAARARRRQRQASKPDQAPDRRRRLEPADGRGPIVKSALLAVDPRAEQGRSTAWWSRRRRRSRSKATRVVFTFAPVHKSLRAAARGQARLDRAAGAGGRRPQDRRRHAGSGSRRRRGRGAGCGAAARASADLDAPGESRADRAGRARRLRRRDRRRRRDQIASQTYLRLREDDTMNIQKMMQQAQQMQEKLQRQMAEMRVEATAGGGMVTVTVNGHKQLLDVQDRSRSRVEGRRRDAAGSDRGGHQRRAPQGGRGARPARCRA